MKIIETRNHPNSKGYVIVKFDNGTEKVLPTTELAFYSLIEAKKKLEEEEYKLRWGGYVHPYQYITSAQYTVTRYWRDKVKELEKELENS